MSAPDRVAVKRTTGFERNYWGVLTHEYDEEGVVYVREDLIAAAILAERERCKQLILRAHGLDFYPTIFEDTAEAISKGGAA